MRKFLLAAAFLALTPAIAPAAASAHAGPDARVHAIHREVVQDRREVREERRELRHARRELHRDHRQLHRARVARARAWHRHHHG
ncbi:MAG: hypothetical protein KGQ75_02975 [Sphingomonadales bacterium]|uniref:hypothetical protein n=1 Tax=unclassified Novosphingobium TaxID=2644732 RepID=UPI0011609F43|nr:MULTISPECIES: hypothetical protein [unclassified Novosphingobium]MBU6393517.1 hypothetical protein [Sphingomonadales bacterium]MBY0392245.1 hypothetical protein [Novosphingobium sp.]